MRTQCEQPETSCPREVLRPGCGDEQGRVLIPILLRNSAHMKGGVHILDYLNYLDVWNHAQFLKNLKRSPLTAQDEKMLNKLSSAPRFPRTIRRNKEDGHVHGTEMRLRIHRRVRPDSRGQASQALTRPRTLGTRQNTPIQFLHPQRGQKTLSQSVLARVTAFVGQGRKHP